MASLPEMEAGSESSPPPPPLPPGTTSSAADGISLPRGFVFKPSDEDLMFYYLQRKISQRESPDVIAEVDVYSHEPSELHAHSKLKSTEKWYFYTPLQGYSSGDRIKRGTAQGRWRLSGSKTTILADKESGVKGKKNEYVFYLKKSDTTKVEEMTDWRMEEYCLENVNTFALCKIFEMKKDIKRKRPVNTAITLPQLNAALDKVFEKEDIKGKREAPVLKQVNEGEASVSTQVNEGEAEGYPYAKEGICVLNRQDRLPSSSSDDEAVDVLVNIPSSSDDEAAGGLANIPATHRDKRRKL